MLKKIIKVLKNPDKIFVALAFKGKYKKMDDEKYLRKMYHGITGRKLNLENPKTFNEKLQWLKLHNRKPEYTMMVDKFLVREYVAKKIGEKHLIPLIGVWDDVDQIDFENLPQQFVLKCNHNSGLGMFICKDKKHMDEGNVRKELKKGLAQDYYLTSREWPYKDVKRKIIAEKYMVDESGVELKDYKVLCFNGEPKLIELHRGRFEGKHTQDFYDCDWNKQPISQDFDMPATNDVVPRPEFLEQMLDLTRVLAKDMPHVRIDWYWSEDRLYFGEITFFDGSGFELFNPDEWDYTLGSWIDLGNVMTN